MDRITKKLSESHTLGPATREWLVGGYQILRHALARAFKRDVGVPCSLYRSRSDSH